MLFKNFGKTRTVFVITPGIALAEDNTASVHTSSVDTLVPILVNDSFGTDFPIAGGLNITNGNYQGQVQMEGQLVSLIKEQVLRQMMYLNIRHHRVLPEMIILIIQLSI